MARMNGKEVNLKNTSDLKLNRTVNGTTGDVFVIGKEQDLEEIAKREAVEKYNKQVDEYVNKFEEHNKLLEKYRKEISKDLDRLEIKPLFEGVLIKPYEENPFQQIQKVGSIITDLGGQKPIYKSRETGQYEEEEAFIKVGLVVDAGPACKYLQEGDVVFWRKPSETPVPFFKQNLILVNEHSIMAIVNQSLSERFKENKND